MRKTLRLAVVALAVLSLAGCGIFFPSARERAAKNSPDFKDGYTDGCASATVQDTTYRKEAVRDEEAYKNSKNYRAGWSSGFYNCRTNTTHQPYTPGVGPIPDNSPGGKTY